MTEIDKGTTDRGFTFYRFIDEYGLKCSLQKSSLATEDAIWFGIDDAEKRMHLTQEMVIEILPILTRFAKTGEI